MFHFRKKAKDAPEDGVQEEPLYKFSERVLTVSLPAAIMLLTLVWADEVQPSSAVVGFGMVVTLTIVLTLPFLTNLQNLAQYTHKLAQDEDVSELPQIGSHDDESARIVAAINQMRNIWTTRAEKLEAQTLSDAAVLDSLPDPLLMLDENGGVTGANLAARETFGFNVRRQIIRDLISVPELLTAVDSVVEERSKKENLEISLNQKVFNAKIERLPAEAKGGAVAVLALYDITPQKQLEQMQADFVANASHELRTPLSILSGFIETLQGPARDDAKAREEFLNIMSLQALRMSRLIENLLSLSRIQMNENTRPSDPVNVCDILRSVQFSLETKAEKSGSSIVLKSCAQEAPVLGNVGELTQVFQNIIDNALKYGRKGSVVTVSCRTENNVDFPEIPSARLFAVAVHNTGDPIPPEHLPRLSERFYRVEATKSKAVGTGLGLSIVQKILKRHSGALKIESSKEVGTVFTVCLPMGNPIHERLPDFGSETSGSSAEGQTAPADSKAP